MHAKEDGFIYLGLLVLVAIMGLVLAALGEQWRAAAQRDKESQLLFAGNQIRAALALYYAHSPAAAPRHPMRLDDLLNDARSPSVERYLRRIYPDPITGSTQWGLVQGSAGEIHGVFSLSELRPLKQGNFAQANKKFSGAQKYSEWVFLFAPGQTPGAPIARHAGGGGL